jgi:signal transduction histidine kinase
LASFFVSPRTLRVIAIIAPVLFAVGVGAIEDGVLEPSMSEIWAHAIVTGVIAIGAVAFAMFIFALLDRTYGQLEEHKGQLERQAVDLRAITEAERRRAHEWKAVFELGREVTASPDLPGLLSSVVSRAKALLNADVAILMLLSPDGSEFSVAAQAGLWTTGMKQLRLPRDHGLQGLVLETGRPVIVENYQTDDRLRDRPAALVAEEGIVSQIAVPFSEKERPLGVLTVANRKPTKFAERHAELLEAFANWAAVATETSHLYDKVESLARLEERDRIGMDLHDGVIQSIYAVGLRLEDYAERAEESPAEVRVGLEKTMDDLNGVIQDIRSYIFDLRPGVSEVDDLPSALSDLVRAVRVNTLMDADLEITGEMDGVLEKEQALSVFHIAQEALNNVARHSGASAVRLLLTVENGRINMTVEDNGQGFDVEEGTGGEGQGIRNMRDRARTLGADLKLHSEPRNGTRVVLELPLTRVEG